jgi:hypothetical protein
MVSEIIAWSCICYDMMRDYNTRLASLYCLSRFGLLELTCVFFLGVTIKYGVTTVDNLCADLLGWKSLYMAGRMHKPIRIIKVRVDPRYNFDFVI